LRALEPKSRWWLACRWRSRKKGVIDRAPQRLFEKASLSPDERPAATVITAGPAVPPAIGRDWKRLAADSRNTQVNEPPAANLRLAAEF